MLTHSSCQALTCELPHVQSRRLFFSIMMRGDAVRAPASRWADGQICRQHQHSMPTARTHFARISQLIHPSITQHEKGVSAKLPLLPHSKKVASLRTHDMDGFSHTAGVCSKACSRLQDILGGLSSEMLLLHPLCPTAWHTFPCPAVVVKMRARPCLLLST